MITGILLPKADLLATIPTELGLLTSLELVDLQKNIIRGTLPTAFTSLPNLVLCNLAGNQLEGAIPAFNSPKLNYLDLSHNSFQGSLPPDFGAENIALMAVDFEYNHLTGYIPFGLEGLSLMNTISFSNNLLSGTLPNYLASLSSLEYLYLNNNDLVGSLPVAWGGKSSPFKEVWLQKNLLSGQVPSSLGQNTLLVNLYLDGNKLTGNIPLTLCHEKLNVDFFQQINKTTPADYCDSIACSSNTVSKDGLYPCNVCEMQEIVNPYLGRAGDCIQLNESIILGNFLAKGAVWQKNPCTYDGVTCNSQGRVMKIIVPGRFLTGTIPDELGLLVYLQELNLSDNSLTGYLPSGLRFAPLDVLDVSRNQLRGIVPPLLCNMNKVNGNGENGIFECTNIVCPVGTFNEAGRGDCRICNDEKSLFLGSATCGSIHEGTPVPTPNSLHLAEGSGAGRMVFIICIVVALLGLFIVTLYMFISRYLTGREKLDHFEEGWTMDEDRSSFPHTDELKARLKRLRRRDSPGDWLRNHFRRAQSYRVSLSETEEVYDPPGTKKVKVHEGEIDDYGWKERDFILKHRDLERAVDQQKSGMSLTVWEYPDPLEQDALTVTSMGNDKQLISDDDAFQLPERSLHAEQKEMFLDVPRIE
jgi:Leucine-rich repeat (LRR) protein